MSEFELNAEEANPFDDATPSALPAPLEVAAGSTEEELSSWAQRVRPSFGKNRQNYNFAVCDALAATGFAPTANMLLRVGRWGTSSSVQADTKAWFQALAERLKQLEASIPLAARRQANQLIEALYKDAHEFVIADAVAPLQQKLDLANAECAALMDVRDEYASAKAVLREELLDVKEKLGLKTTQNERLHELLADANLAFSGEQVAHASTRDTAAAGAAQAKQALLEVSAASSRELLAANTQAEAERRRLMLASDGERVEHAKRLGAVSAELVRLKEAYDLLTGASAQLTQAKAVAEARVEGLERLLDVEQKQSKEKDAVITQLRSPEFDLFIVERFVREIRSAGVELLQGPNFNAEALAAHFGVSLHSVAPMVAKLRPYKTLLDLEADDRKS